MDYDLELKNEKLENMIHVYEEHIDALEKENKQLRAQVDFLKEQLEYKTFGKPLDLEEEE
jgi:cell division septum initiation protein DivIVA